MSKKGNVNKRDLKFIVIAVIAMILALSITACVIYFAYPAVWAELFGERTSEGTLAVHFIDVGQGDCIYIAFPDGSDMLIDCGNRSSGYNFDDTMEYLDSLNADGSIDHLMLTHTDEDHVEYLDELIYAYDIGNIYMPNVLAAPKKQTLKDKIAALDQDKLALFTDDDVITTEVYANFFIAALTEENCSIHLNVDADETSNSIVISDGSTYTLTFYCPTAEYYEQTDLSDEYDKNAVSPVGVLCFGGRRIVFTGDSNKQNEPIVARRIGRLDCDVLKVAHHGSGTSSTDEFLDAVDCEYAIISCNAAGNTYHHPTQSALNRFITRGMTIYRTDNNGNIVLTVSGNGDMSFDLEKQATQEKNRKGATA